MCETVECKVIDTLRGMRDGCGHLEIKTNFPLGTIKRKMVVCVRACVCDITVPFNLGL